MEARRSVFLEGVCGYEPCHAGTDNADTLGGKSLHSVDNRISKTKRSRKEWEMAEMAKKKSKCKSDRRIAKTKKIR